MSTDWISAIAQAVAAVGTVGTLVFALMQIRTEREERKRAEADAKKRGRRSQAEKISAWVTSYGEVDTPIAMRNASDAPIYNVIVSLVLIQGAGPRTGREWLALDNSGYAYFSFLSSVPPGQTYTTVSGGWGGMGRRPGVEIAFTDSADRSWLRTATGRLEELSHSPPDYYAVSPPIDWRVPFLPTESPPEADIT
jgi:hypothetical protein